MHRWPLFFLLLTFAFTLRAAETPQPAAQAPQGPAPAAAATAPKPQEYEPRAQNAEWLAAINRLRSAPQAGEIINGGVTANIAGVVQLNEAEKAKVAALQEAYTAALVAQAAKWEAQLKSLRAEYDAKIAAALPENRRESAAKLLELSHAGWGSEFDFENGLTREFLKRMKGLPQIPPDEQRSLRRSNLAWFAQQRAQHRQMQEQLVAKLKALLTSDEATRLDLFDRNRTVPQAGK